MGCGITKDQKIERQNNLLTSKGMPVSNKKIMDFVVRKEINDISHEELIRFFDAVRTMMHNKEGKPGSSDFFRIAGYSGWPSYHAQMGSETFAIWHRMLLVEFEQALQKADKTNGNDGKISLPYWDWSHNTFPKKIYDLYREFPKSFFPENDPNSEEFSQVLFTKRRSPQEISDYIKASRAPELAEQALSLSEHWKFSSTKWRGVGASVEAANNAIHMACGFPMSSMKFAAFDILYWLHHCNVDRYFTKYLHMDFDAYQEFYNSQKIISEQKDLKNLATLPLEPFRHPQSNKHAMPRDCFEDTKTMGYLYDVLPPKPQVQNSHENPYYALFEGIEVKNLNGKSFILHVFAIDNQQEDFELPNTFEKIINCPNYAGFTSVITGLNYFKKIGNQSEALTKIEPINATVDINLVIKRQKLVSDKIALKVVCEDEYGQFFNIEDIPAITLPKVIGPFFENNDRDITKTNARENYNIQKYLEIMGYYHGTKDGVLGEQSIHAIKEFQKSMGIQGDGLLGARTKQFFIRPRHDYVRDHDAKTSKFAQIIDKFEFKEVKFFIGVQPGYIIREELADEIEQAIRLWDNHDNSIFTKVTQVFKEKHACVKIYFDDLTQNNLLHYDGIEGNLVRVEGHTLTFDLSRRWLLKHMAREVNGFRFQEVFLHGFGHILGIEHTLLPGNIMFPYYEEGVKRLGSQDLHSFNMIYTKNYSGQNINNSINKGPNQNSSIGPQKDNFNDINNQINMDNNVNNQGFYDNNTQNKSKITKESNFNNDNIKNYNIEKQDEMKKENIFQSNKDQYTDKKESDLVKNSSQKEEKFDNNNNMKKQENYDDNSMKKQSVHDEGYWKKKLESSGENVNTNKFDVEPQQIRTDNYNSQNNQINTGFQNQNY
ncbi:putative domain, di-copper centre [Pseudocohnilembus persalinus]|uniref:Putative domain, di-copper centre n=1 Tax=Pseudocohnilembus persalinus TaxID=266149 RepID=A0A0V0R8Y7_PSEPJ|nr:putative domain, di-copper centre [Pseudocohnilembus persalinus]|eukprot:KRX10972.1 putative domain, di-copper centre [Pseudocohnilembus persalinus]